MMVGRVVATLAAPRHRTGVLYHYTKAAAAIEKILPTGTLRLSPFPHTNDLWESRPVYLGLSSHDDDHDTDFGFELWEDIDTHTRRHVKVACLTQDWQFDERVFNPDVIRGWAHLSLWAHYGDSHQGICLGFDQDKLVKSFMNGPVVPTGHRFHGQVQYRHDETLVGGLDIG